MALIADERTLELTELQARMRACRRCVEAGHVPHAQPVFSGRATDRVMVIGQAPGPVSDDRGIPFAGPAGRVLVDWFQQAGFPAEYFRERTYLTSLTRCFPGKSPHGAGDRPPSRAERALCQPYLDAELAIIRPSVILLVGKLAIDEFLAKRLAVEGFRGASLEQVVGTAVERDGVFYLPLPHSSGVSRWLNAPEHRALVAKALERLSEARRTMGLDGTQMDTDAHR